MAKRLGANTISMQMWRSKHITKNTYSTDHYYYKLANRILANISILGRKMGIANECLAHFALNATAYFEDVVSEIGMWNAFVSKHKELYGKWLPFYDTNTEGRNPNYYVGEVNNQDLYLILWMALTYSRPAEFINPETANIKTLGDIICKILDEEFEKAPINDDIIEDIYTDKIQDFMYAKDMMKKMVESSYLFSQYTQLDYDTDDAFDMFYGLFGDMADEDLIMYSVLSYLGVERRTGPLALKAGEWLGEMYAAKGREADADALRAIETRPLQRYFVRQTTETRFVVRNIMDDEELEIIRDSIADKKTSVRMMDCVLAKYRGVWNVCGMASLSSEDDVSEKEAEKQRNELRDAYIIQKGKYISSMDAKKVDKLLKKNGGNRLFFFENKEELLDWECEAFGAKGSNDDDEISLDGRIVAFIGEDNTISITGMAEGVKAKNNPHYDKAIAKEYALNAVEDRELLSVDMLKYLIANGCLEDAALNSLVSKERGRELLQDNIRFIARMRRCEEL